MVKVSVLVVNVDHYLTKLSVDAELKDVKKLPWQELRPVIRVFGSCALGQKACIHIHGVLPYIYFRPENVHHSAFESQAKISRILPVLERALEDAMHIRRVTIANRAGRQTELKRRRHINHLEIVRKKSIYGMWTEESYFIKAYLNDPMDKQRLASILDEGPLAGISMNAYEAHIPYILQFTSDYNIAPMGWLHLNDVKFRLPLPSAPKNKPKEDFVDSTPKESAPTAPPIHDTMESPIFRFLSSFSSTPSLPSTSPIGCLMSQHPSLTMYTQETVPVEQTWSAQSAITETDSSQPPPMPAIDEMLSEEQSKEVKAILEAITEEDLVWSQFDQRGDTSLVPGNPPLPAAPVAPTAAPETALTMAKDSICELELDTHGEQILNQHLLKADFGAELWAEERLRCERLGLVLPQPPVHPSTELYRREVHGKEADYLERFEGLIAKGKALRRKSRSCPSLGLSQAIVGTQSAPVLSTPTDGDFLSSSGEHDQVPNDHVEPAREGVERWADDVLAFTAQEAKYEEEIVRDLLNDPEIALEENFKSQVATSQHVSSSHDVESRQTRRPMAGVAMLDTAAEEDEEEVHSQASIQRENDDILASTQLALLEDKNEEKPVLGAVDASEAAGPQPTNSLLDVSTPARKPPLAPIIITSGRKRNREVHDLATALGGFSQLQSPAVQPPASPTFSTPAAVDLCTPDTDPSHQGSAIKKQRRRKSVTFAMALTPREDSPSLLPSPSVSAAPPSSTTKEKAVVPDKAPASDNSTLQSSYPTSSASEKRIHMHTITAPLYPVATTPSPHVRQVGRRRYYLTPSFSAPRATDLKRLEEYGMAEVQNIPAHFSSREDAEIEAKALQSARGSGSYAALQAQRRVVRWKDDWAQFDGGEASGSSTRHQSPTALPRRQRCLLPTFSPPILTPSDVEAWSVTASPASLPPHSAPFPSPAVACATATQSSASTASVAPGLGAGVGVGAEGEIEGLTRLSAMSMEVFCRSRRDFRPNPKFDSIDAIAWITEDIIRTASEEHVHRFGGIIATIPSFFDLSSQELSSAMDPSGVAEQKGEPPSTASHRLQALVRSAHLPADTAIQVVETERDLFKCFLQRVQDLDPDILMGFENTTQSFGLFIQRGRRLGINCLQRLSRIPKEKPSFRNPPEWIDVEDTMEDDELKAGADEHRSHGGNAADSTKGGRRGSAAASNDEDVPDSGIFITGRTFLDVWQIVCSEVKVADCSLTQLLRVVAQQTLPFFSPKQLTEWALHPTTYPTTLSYLYSTALANVVLLEKLDFFRKVGECARLYGIDFFSVVTRGSQYRVEAALLYRAHRDNYLLISPSRDRVAGQAPMEVIPLVLEPRSAFYPDPVVVLDFQSLYPSIMIAFNICFSTIMGKLKPGRADDVNGDDTTGRLGTIAYPEAMAAVNATIPLPASPKSAVRVGPQDKNEDENKEEKEGEEALRDFVINDWTPYVSPNGSIFAPKAARQGVLPRMVDDMLKTRVMVKAAMKQHSGKRHKVLQKVLDARQLAIKLLANVTYGYTAAGFSGRMPMAELADAIVQTGRTLLEHTIRTINGHPQWRAEVVYGDTDSVFVHLPGRSLEEAFRIGEEIASDITRSTPSPLVLKFEKVYYPCLLVTKKRYVGQAFENKRDLSQSFLDAKGIEMIRKDQCVAVQKIQERVLRILFKHRDLSLIKRVLVAQWRKLFSGDGAGGELALQDFIFYKEVRFGQYHSASSQPPGAIVATKAVLVDEMAVPPYNWRVPYLVVYGPPNTPLKHLVHDPKDVLRRGSGLRINLLYYVVKCINPALDRVLRLCGVDVDAWFRAMPRPKARVRHLNYAEFSADVLSNGESGGRAVGAGGATRLFPPNRRGNQGISAAGGGVQSSMDRFTTQALCSVCGEADAQPRRLLCKNCLSPANLHEAYLAISFRLRGAQRLDERLTTTCRLCAPYQREPQTRLFLRNELVSPEACEALACPVFHERWRLALRLEDLVVAMRDIEDIGK